MLQASVLSKIVRYRQGIKQGRQMVRLSARVTRAIRQGSETMTVADTQDYAVRWCAKRFKLSRSDNPRAHSVTVHLLEPVETQDASKLQESSKSSTSLVEDKECK